MKKNTAMNKNFKNNFIITKTMMFDLNIEEDLVDGEISFFDNYVDIIIDPSSDDLKEFTKELKSLFFQDNIDEMNILFYGKEKYTKEKIEILLELTLSLKKLKKVFLGYAAKIPYSNFWTFDDVLNESTYHTPIQNTLTIDLSDEFSCESLDFGNIPVSLSNIEKLDINSLSISIKDEGILKKLMKNTKITRLNLKVLDTIQKIENQSSTNKTLKSLHVSTNHNNELSSMNFLTEVFSSLTDYSMNKYEDMKQII